MSNQRIVLGTVNLGQFESISLNFILPVMLGDGKIYYFLDSNGNGLGTAGVGADPRRYQDAITHDVLDSLFNNSINTTDTQSSGAVYGVDDARTALVSDYTLVLPTSSELLQLQDFGKYPTNLLFQRGWADANWYWSASYSSPGSYFALGLNGGSGGYTASGVGLFCAVQLISSGSLSVDILENSSVVTDLDVLGFSSSVVFSISGVDADKFIIDPLTGGIQFKALPDFENPTDLDFDNRYQVTVEATDGTTTSTEGITVIVSNTGEAPQISSNGAGESASLSVSENLTAVTTVTATDPDAGTTLAYSIIGGVDSAKFKINSSTGDLSFITAPNSEAPTDVGGDNVYEVTVQVSDGDLTDTQTISVKVISEHEAKLTFGNEYIVNSNKSQIQDYSLTAALGNGNYVVTWQDPSGTLGDSSFTSIKAQIFDGDGAKIGSEFLVNTQVLIDQVAPSVATLSNGNFVITWTDADTSGDGSLSSVKAQIFDSSGQKVGSEFLVNTQASRSQGYSAVTALADGEFVVTWRDFSGTLGDSSRSSIKGQIFLEDGSKNGSEFLVNTKTIDYQAYPSISALSSGGFVVSWTDTSGTNADSNGTIKAQIFDHSGNKVGNEFSASSHPTLLQRDSCITSLRDGSFVISWVDSSGTLGDSSLTSVRAQVFSADGSRVGEEISVNTAVALGQENPSVTSLTNGGFLVAWHSTRRG